MTIIAAIWYCSAWDSVYLYASLLPVIFVGTGPTSTIIVADNLGIPILQFVLCSRCYKIKNYFGYTFMNVVLSAKQIEGIS